MGYGMTDAIGYVRFPPRFWPSAVASDSQILTKWCSGLDTYAIATDLGCPQHEIERRLHTILEKRRQDAEWNLAPEPVRTRLTDDNW